MPVTWNRESSGGVSSTKTTATHTGDVVITDKLTVGSNTLEAGVLTGAINKSGTDITNCGTVSLNTLSSNGSDIIIDSERNIVLDADHASGILFKDGGVTYGSISKNSNDIEIKSGSSPTAAITLTGANVKLHGTLSMGSLEIAEGSDGGSSRQLSVGYITIDYDGSTDSCGYIKFAEGDASFGTDRDWYVQQRKDTGNKGDFWIEYKVIGGSWYQPFKIDAASGDDALVIGASGNIGIGTTTFDGSAVKHLAIANGTGPSAHTDNQIYIGARDASTTSESTLALFCEEDPVAHDSGGAFTNSHKMKVWLNNTEYWIVLDAV